MQSKKTDLDALAKKAVLVEEIKWRDQVFETTKFPVKLLNGAYGVGAYVKDVTEDYNNKKKLAEMNAALNRANALLTAILESSPEVIVFALDTKYCYLSFNSKHQKTIKGIWGREIEIGLNMLEVIGRDEDRIKAKENFDRALDGESFTLTEEYGDPKRSRGVWQNYYAPIHSNDGKVIGLTCFVLNITDRVKAEEEIVYLSFHDPLTGLYNRRFVEEELQRLDTERNLPLSIIMGDVNGLKLTNDIFGHEAGDLLLQKATEAMKRAGRKDDVISRWGGDEFILILPKTTAEEGERIRQRIKDQFAQERIKGINGSISLGCDTKYTEEESIAQTIKNAEEKMYEEKTLDRKNFSNDTIKSIIKAFYENSPEEAEHAKRVSALCVEIGKAVHSSGSELKRLESAGYLHDLGKIVVEKDLLKKNGPLTGLERQKLKEHPVVGFRIANSAEETFEVAKYILSHHERWDGTGYPKGLQGKDIHKVSRIIALAESYDVMINGAPYRKPLSKVEALEEIKQNAGTQFDPQIVEAFLEMLKKEERFFHR